MKGQTLVEMMVAIGVVIALSGALLAYNHTTDQRVVIFKDQSILVGALNRAKALSQQKFDAQNVCAFGVHILSNNTFLIFGDQKPANISACVDNVTGAYESNFRYDNGEETLTYPSGATEKNIFTLDPTFHFAPSDVGLDVVFIPPDVFVTSTMPLPVSITIENQDGSMTAKTGVSFGGQIITN